jgi:hypothetical protein
MGSGLVAGTAGTRSGIDARSSPLAADGPLVGRAHELEALASWVLSVSEGGARTAVVEGEAGVGKSDRLPARR